MLLLFPPTAPPKRGPPPGLARPSQSQPTPAPSISSSFGNVEDEDSEDEDGLKINEVEMMAATLRAYDSGSGDSALVTTQERLRDSCRSQNQVCLICLDKITHSAAIWSCRVCSCMFHLQCIQHWIRDGVQQKSLLSDENFPTKDRPWCCPNCRHEYLQTDYPSRYRCFCGKKEDPPFDPWLAPHSCGERCDKLLRPVCGHSCVLLCHPGPCPPCPKDLRDTPCFCGKQKSVRRCHARNYSCGSVCGQLLACGTHRCTRTCHEGDCPPCSKQSTQSCACGRHTQTVACASPQWRCEDKCSKPFPCGHHTCETICHSGRCGDCPRSGVRTCPCGKTQHSLPCTQDVSTCGDTCGKSLDCKRHECADPCHVGPCRPCMQIVTKSCKCGRTKKKVPCHKTFACDRKCAKMKACTRHACKRRCCTGNCPPCEEVCKRMLGCQNHRCQAPCHPGPCYPCNVKVTLACRCSVAKRVVPCGRERVVRVPHCKEKCKLPPYCRHKAQAPHACHRGECPTCSQDCGQPLKCGHKCIASCHDQRPVLPPPTNKAEERQRKKLLQDMTTLPPEKVPRLPLVPTKCPPCSVPLEQECVGLHITRTIECSKISVFKCTQECGRQLSCERHTCGMGCHAPLVEGKKWKDLPSHGVFCAPCIRRCSLPRPEGCPHKCERECHPDECAPCDEVMQIYCHCKTLKLTFQCHEITSKTIDERQASLVCGQRCSKLLSCGHRCRKNCHVGDCSPVSECKKKLAVVCSCKRRKEEVMCGVLATDPSLRKLKCDDECAALKANKEAAKTQTEQEKPESSGERIDLVKSRRKKRKRHRYESAPETPSFFEQYKLHLMAVVAALVAMVAVLVILVL
eukprot:m.218839 g.218839  ORF g.218839 m.218839 type:complete len:853 (-) comp26271_c0_seq1:99-2657(-)